MSFSHVCCGRNSGGKLSFRVGDVTLKIKLAILDSDANYLNRIASVFTNRFSDKLEVYSFTDTQAAMQNLKPSRINVFIAGDAFDIDFVSASGGVGSSSAAVACAKNFAASGQKTAYLNLEQFGSVEPFFSGVGQTDFSDVIFALKRKKTN
jgi:hypothetical protein